MRAEIAIRGAGPVGSVLALALRQAGRSVVLHDPKKPTAAFRPIALSHGSRLILERLGAWQALATTPIGAIHVSQQGAFGRTRMSAADAGVPALGHVVEYGKLLDALLNRLEEENIPIRPEAAGSMLVVHAEGVSDEATEKSYGQEAIVARVATRPTAADTAWERFTPEGPLALLPLAGRYGLVWAMAPERALDLSAAHAQEFLAVLGRAFGRRAGEFVAVSERGRMPLALRVRPARVGAREVYVGNAAQSLHPVAGQGLNLGLRDAWDLARVLRDVTDPGDQRVLARFAARRRLDVMAAVRTTDFLASAFLAASPLGAPLRGFGLTALDICPPARRFFARRMIYGTSAVP